MGKNSFPPTPFLFAHPSVQFRFCRAKRGNQSGFCSKWVLTFSNKHHVSKFINKTHGSEPVNFDNPLTREVSAGAPDFSPDAIGRKLPVRELPVFPDKGEHDSSFLVTPPGRCYLRG